MDLSSRSKEQLTTDVKNLLSRHHFNKSLHSPIDVQTLVFKKQYRKKYKLVLIFLPKVLSRLVIEYLQNDINVSYSLSHVRCNQEKIFLGIELAMSNIRLRMNIDSDCGQISTMICNVETNIFDEFIEKYNKHHYYLIHDYVSFFDKYMSYKTDITRSSKNILANYQGLHTCNCYNRIKYAKSGDTYTSLSVCNKADVKVIRHVKKHNRLQNTILILNIITNLIVSIIKK